MHLKNHLFYNRTFQIFIITALYLIFIPYLPEKTNSLLYTISLCIKDILLWMLPITVSLFIAHAISSFEKTALLFVIILFLFEAISNSLSVAYGAGHLLHSTIDPIQPSALLDSFSALWRIPFTKPSWWSADKGTFLGILIGLISASKNSNLKNFVSQGKQIVEKILTSFFAKLIPLFILGFIARLNSTHLLSQIYSQYAPLLLELIVLLVVYIGLLFFLGKGAKVPSFGQRIKNLIPAASMSFSSGCSLSTMPWTIEGTAKNLENPPLAKAIIPATTNIQQIGDCIINTFLCFLIYYQFYDHPPSFSIWLSFSLIFVLARFATAAVIGGAIFVMLPVYETYLHFTPEMIAIILAFNVILDPLVTCSNVVANAALCRIFEKTWNAIKRRFPEKIAILN